MTEVENIIVIPNSALFELGVSVGFGAVLGAAMAAGFSLIAMAVLESVYGIFKSRGKPQ